MAIYNTRNKRGGRAAPGVNSPQQAQSVNVGQFGPSHDSLQDWRSIFTALNEVKKMATDLYDVDVKVTELIVDAEEAVRVATNAAATATEINEDTIENVESRWQQIAIVQQEVEASETATAESADTASTKASEASEDARQAEIYVQDASVLKKEMEDIRDDVTNLTAGLSVVDEAADARAEFNNVTNHLQLYVPKVNVGGTAAITSVNGKLGPTVQLSAEDVHALPNSGDVAIKDKLSFDCGENRRFEINALMTSTSRSTEPQFSISYHYTDIKDNMHGMILDKIGNAAFGGELFVKNTKDAATRKKVYHEGYKPTPQDIGAAVASDTYTKSDTYSREESYSRTQVNTELAKKVELNKNDGGIYARQNANWVDINTVFSSMFPVGHVIISTNSSNPSTYGYPGKWTLQEGDASIHTTSSGAGGVTGSNTPAVPLPSHRHMSWSSTGKNYNGMTADTTPVRVASQGAGGLTNENFEYQILSNSSVEPSIGRTSISGVSNATLDVRGKRITVYMWERTA